MGINPVPAVTYVVLWTVVVGIILGSDVAVQTEFPACDSLTSVLAGCGSFVTTMLTTFLVGSVPGAPVVVNIGFSIVGIVSRLTIIWAVMEWLRGN